MTDVTTEILPASAENIEKIAQILNRGDIAAIPTETVYGLAANALLDTAIAKIFAAKNRPRFNPLIVHVADYAQAAQYAVFTKLANRLADAFWPGPLTMVLNLRPESGGFTGDFPPGHREFGHNRHSLSGAPYRANRNTAIRRSAGGAIGERVRPDQPDRRRACRRIIVRPHRLDFRWRRLRRWIGIDNRRFNVNRPANFAPGRVGQRRYRIGCGNEYRNLPPADFWRSQIAGHVVAALRATREIAPELRQSQSQRGVVGIRRECAGRFRRGFEPKRARRFNRSRREFIRAFARAGSIRVSIDRGHADSANRIGIGDQRPDFARRRQPE